MIGRFAMGCTLFGTKRHPASPEKGDQVVEATIGSLAAGSQSCVTCVLTPDEWRFARRLRLAALADHESPLYGDLEQETAWGAIHWRKEVYRSHWFVAKYLDEPVGMGKVVDYPDEDPRYHLESMWVKSEHRRRGVGKLLLREAESYASSMGQLRLGLWVIEGNQAAMKLYVEAGYCPTGRCGEINGMREAEFARTIN